MHIPCEQHYHDDLHDPFAAHFLQQSVCGVWTVVEGEYREYSPHNSIARGLRPRTVQCHCRPFSCTCLRDVFSNEYKMLVQCDKVT